MLDKKLYMYILTTNVGRSMVVVFFSFFYIPIHWFIVLFLLLLLLFFSYFEILRFFFILRFCSINLNTITNNKSRFCPCIKLHQFSLLLVFVSDSVFFHLLDFIGETHWKYIQLHHQIELKQNYFLLKRKSHGIFRCVPNIGW